MAKGYKFGAELKGAKELEDALRKLPRNLGRSSTRRSLKKSAEPIAKDASRRAPVGPTGRLSESIAVSTTLSRRQRRERRIPKDEIVVFIGAGPARHAVLAEFGTGERRTKTGKSTGAMPAHPFMRPAWEAGKFRALDEFGKEWGEDIERTAERLARREAKKARAAK